MAVEHLTALGMQVLARNWRCRYGELDVIATDPSDRTLVFVEVKTRTGDGFGGLPEAVTARRFSGSAGWRRCGWPSRTATGRRCASTWSACGSGAVAAAELTHLKGVG